MYLEAFQKAPDPNTPKNLETPWKFQKTDLKH